MKNTLQTPWRVEPTGGWPGLFDVYDCGGNVVAAAKIEEVAKLIANAPATRALLDAQMEPTISVYADPKQYDLDSWLPTSDPYFLELEDEGAIEVELGYEDDDPSETFLDYGSPGAGDIDGREMASADVEYDCRWLQI